MAYSDRDGGGHRALWIAMVVVLVSVGGLAGFIVSLFDADNLKARFIAAVGEATGRTLTVAGPVSIGFSLNPTIVMDNVSLSNPPGFSRPEMMTAKRLEIALALSPLIDKRIEVDHVSLVEPALFLETDKQGRGNWIVTRERVARDAPADNTPRAVLAASSGRYALSVHDVRIHDGSIGWLDGVNGQHVTAQVPRVTVEAPDGAPMTAKGEATVEGRPVALTVETGPLDQLRYANEGSPWPVRLDLNAAGASLGVQGRIARPLRGQGYSFQIDSRIPDPTVLARLFPGVPLASMKDVTARADIRDDGTGNPAIPAMEVKIGSSDLGRLVTGARMEDLTLTAREGLPLKIVARLALPGLDAGMTGTAGDLTWLSKGASGPLDVDLEWNAASARAGLKGRIEQPLKLKGYAFDVAMNVPNPALLTDSAPSALKAVTLQTRLTDDPGPVAFQMTSSAGDLAGALEVSARPGWSVTGKVRSRSLDLDVLRSRPAADAPAAEPRADRPARRDRLAPLFSDTPFPLDWLKATTIGLSLDIGVLHWAGAGIRGAAATLTVKDGVARLDPLTISGPDQRLNAVLEADMSVTPPHWHLTLDAPAVAVRPLLEMAGLPPAVTAPAEVHANLTASGASVKALAGSVTGTAGLAVRDGQLDTRIVNSWLESLRPLRIEGGDNTELRCFAVRLDARDGIAAIDPVALNTVPLIVEGSGDVDLGHETMNLRVRPRARFGGLGIAAPLRLTGPLRAPGAKLDISAAGGLAGQAGLLLGGKDIMGAAGGADPCPAAVARVSGMAPEGSK